MSQSGKRIVKIGVVQNEEDKKLVKQTSQSMDQKQDAESQRQKEKDQEERDAAGKKLDDIEKIVSNDSSFIVNLLLLGIYILVIVQIFMEYRISDVYDTRQSVADWVNQRITVDLSKIQQTSRIYSDYLYPIIFALHDKNITNNQISLLFNPQVQKFNVSNNYSDTVFLNNFNYYLGSKVTIKLKTNTIDNDADNVLKTLVKYKTYTIDNAYSDYSNKKDFTFYTQFNQSSLPVNNTDLLTLTRTYIFQLIEDDSGFTLQIVFQNQLSQKDAITKYLGDTIKNQFQATQYMSVQHDIYTLNPITEVLIKYTNQFDINNQGRIQFYESTQFTPYYYINSKTQSNVVFALVAKSLFAAVVFVQILTAIGIRIFYMFIKYLSTRIFEFEFDLLLVTAQRTVNLVYVIFWFIQYLQFQQIKLEQQMKLSEFSDLDLYYNNFDLYQLFAILTLIISIYDVIKIMASFFPSFGVLIYTFSVAGKDILIFVSVTCLMLVSFIIISNILFGPQNINLSSMGNASLFCFEFASGLFKFSELTQIDPTKGYIFGLIFIITFVFVLFPYFYGIIIYTYGILRKDMQLPTQALAEIAADKSTKATMKWINLIFFVPPKTEEQVQKEEEDIKKKREERQRKRKEQLKNNKKSKKNQNDTKIQHKSNLHSIMKPDYRSKKAVLSPDPEMSGMQQQSQGKLRSQLADTQTPNKQSERPLLKKKNQKKKDDDDDEELNIKEIFMYNFLQLDIKNVLLSLVGFGQPDLLTKQQRIEEITRKMDDIKKRRKDQAVQMKKQKQDNLFLNLKDGFLHIIFLIFLIIGFEQQTLRSLAYNQESYIQTFFNSAEYQQFYSKKATTFTIDSIETSQNINGFVTQVLLPAATKTYISFFDNEDLSDYDVFIGVDPIRLSFRLYQPLDLSFFADNNEIMFYGRPAKDMEVGISGVAGEKQANFYDDGYEFYYRPPGDSRSAYKAGGYPFKINEDIVNAVSRYEYLTNQRFIGSTTGLINFEFIIYNPTQDLYSFVCISFQVMGAGSISPKITIDDFPLTLYSGPRLTRLVFEIIVLLFHIKFWRKFLDEWMEVWEMDEAYEFMPFDMPEDKSLVERLLNIDLQDKKNAKLHNLLFAIGKRVYGFLIRFLTSLKLMVQKTFFNILLITGVVLMFVQIIFWIQISLNPFRIFFDYYQNKHTVYEPGDLIDSFLTLAILFRRYNIIASFILFNEMFRVMFYFSFSAKLSQVLDIIASASIDIVFFMIMFILILFAFSAVGVLLFGHENVNFSQLLRSIVKCLDLFATISNMDKQSGDYYAMGEIIFYFSLMTIIYFVLIRMLIAILDGHYMEIMANDSGSRKGLVDTIMDILKAEYDNLEQEEKEKEAEEQEQNEVEVQTLSSWRIIACFQETITKIRVKIELIYKRLYSLFKIYRKMLLDYLFPKQQNNEDNDNLLEQDNDDNQLILNLDFKDTKNEKVGRLGPVEEIQQYTLSKEMLDNLAILSGKKHKSEQFKKTLVGTWINALEQGIRDVASTSLQFSDYYSPKSTGEQYGLLNFQKINSNLLDNFINIDTYKDDQGMSNVQIFLPRNFDIVIVRIFKDLQDKLMTKTKEPFLPGQIYQQIQINLDYMLYYFVYHILLKEDGMEKIEMPQQQNDQQDISLINIPQYVEKYIVDLEKEEVQGQSRVGGFAGRKQTKKLTYKSVMKSEVNVQQSEQFIQKLNKESLETMNHQQIISVLSRFTPLFTIWHIMKLNDKLFMWFGSAALPDQKETDEKIEPCLQLYQKVAFWNLAGWDKRSLYKVPNIKKDLDSIEHLQKNQANIIEEDYFIQLWDQLKSSRTTDNRNMNEEEEEDLNQGLQFLPISLQQINFVQYFLRGNDNLLERVVRAKTFQEKLAILKKSHIINDHKIVIWMLMNPLEKFEMIMNQEIKQQSQFMILMLVEELYDNLIMLQKIENDAIQDLNTKIYQMYHNFSEYNALQTAVQLRQKFTQQSVTDPKEYQKYMNFLRMQLMNSSDSIQKYSDFILQKKQEAASKPQGVRFNRAQAPQEGNIFKKDVKVVAGLSAFKNAKQQQSNN